MNREEQRRLTEIERQLRREDPQLAEHLTRSQPARRPWARPVAVMMAVLSIFCVLIGIASGSVMLVVSGLALLNVAVWLFRRRRFGVP